MQRLSPNRVAIRNRILQAAGEVLVAEGVHGTVVRTILERAGVARRTFYGYFRGQHEVLVALYGREMEAMVQHLQEALSSEGSEEERLDRVIGAYLDFQVAGGQLLVLLQGEAVRADSVLAPRRQVALDALVAVIDEQVAGHLGRRFDPLLYRTLLMGIEGLALHTGGIRNRERCHHILKALILNLLAGHDRLPTVETQ